MYACTDDVQNSCGYLDHAIACLYRASVIAPTRRTPRARPPHGTRRGYGPDAHGDRISERLQHTLSLRHADSDA